MTENSPAPHLQIKIQFPAGFTFGPGKADLLEHIDKKGSIAAAGRAMSMSYKRAWSLVEEMNAAFAKPVVERSRGGAAGGGASLTETGHQALQLFRTMEAQAQSSSGDTIANLIDLLGDMSHGK